MARRKRKSSIRREMARLIEKYGKVATRRALYKAERERKIGKSKYIRSKRFKTGFNR